VTDYVETRKASLTPPAGAKAQLPRALRASVLLKPHQLAGVAWFQHLYSKAPHEVRGCLLADDMGLGKTLQLLNVLGKAYEDDPDAPPSLILVPKTLLQNWASEVEKFFSPSYPKLLVLYGDELIARKQPRSRIDEELRTKGIADLLAPHWVGAHKVIITTYDVLTGYEFSFAKQDFTFVICDEAQRIKNPATKVSCAVRKLKAKFRVACTGTPVENSLVDLWCLFDFFQPGLLGSLEEFFKTYRKPIECESEDQVQALKRLQSIIRPQTLRRTKNDIAADLPRKFFAVSGQSLSDRLLKPVLENQDLLKVDITDHQRVLYKSGLKRLHDAQQDGDGKRRSLLSFAALHFMKAVCAEPYCLPGKKFTPDPGGVAAHLKNSPKLAWMIEELKAIRDRSEKAIIFTEIREVQTALHYFLRECFGLRPFIVNGESENRQSYIDRFAATEGFDAIILSPLAAGAGLNVVAANHVFHFTRAWNPAKEAQATDRAYRIGQERDVTVYCPTVVDTADTRYYTFEQRLDQLLKEKTALAQTTIDGDDLSPMLNGSMGDIGLSELLASTS
jgi:SNF2 family DNA or RNA helicase